MSTVGDATRSDQGSSRGDAARTAMIVTMAIAVGLLVSWQWHSLAEIDGASVVIALSAAGAVILGLLAVTRFWVFISILLAIRSAIDGFGVDAESGGGISPSTAVGALLLVATAAWMLARWRTGRLRPVSIGGRWGLAFAVAAMIGVPLSVSPGTSAEEALKVLAIVCMVLVLEQAFADDPSRLRPALGVVALSIVVPFVVGLSQLFGNGFVDDTIDVDRVRGSFVHPNALATYCTIVLAYTLGVFPHLTRRWRYVSVGVGAAAGLLLLFSYARASWAGAIVVVLVVGVLQDRRLLAGLIVMGVALLILVPSVGTRLGDLNNSGSDSYEGNSLSWRWSYWGDAIDTAEGRRILGTGLGTTPLLLEEELDVHNSFLQSFVEMGVLGLVSFVGWLVAIGITVRRSLGRAPPGLARGMAVGAAAAATNVAVQFTTENHLTAVAPLWYLAVGLGWCFAVANGALSEADPTPGSGAHPASAPSTTG